MKALYLVVLSLVIVVASLVIWWTFFKATPKQTSSLPIQAVACGVPAGQAIEANHLIDLSNVPALVEVEAGQTVAWTNSTDTVVSLSATVDKSVNCSGFETQQLSPGQTYKFTFLLTGDWRFTTTAGGHMVVRVAAEK